ncbi:MAG: HAD family hydrolase [Treponema sp.]|nr:HAD family hydrolase [Treponema sp.]
MIIINRRFDGIAFDLDGTLYPNYRLNIRIIPSVLLKEFSLLWALGKARDRIRSDPEACPQAGFYETQARLMAEILKEEPDTVQKKVGALIYRGWEPLFTRIAPFPHVRETLEALRKEGCKLGLLSDFPPEAKLVNMGLDGYWDTVLCSETTGRLKPHPLPFLELARQMGMPPERILYVGNSVRYDIIGAKGVGMKAALVTRSIIKKIHRPGNADFVFSDYRQLLKYMISLL